MGGESIRQLKLGIYIVDEAYMLMLMNAINSDTDNSFLAIAFSSKERLKEFLKTESLDLLVIDDEEAFSGEYEVPKLILTVTKRDNMPENMVFKYSKVESIIKSISKISNKKPVGILNSVYKTYAVISPVGRCGKTNLALALCREDQVRGSLYLGFEEHGGLPFAETDKIMSNLLYLVCDRSEKISDYIEEKVKKINDIAVLPSPSTYLDLRFIERDDVAFLVEAIIKWGRYSTVVFDIGGSSLGDMRILECFDKIYMPVLEDKVSRQKINGFFTRLKEENLIKIADKIVKIKVPNAAYDSKELMALTERLM